MEKAAARDRAKVESRMMANRNEQVNSVYGFSVRVAVFQVISLLFDGAFVEGY
jgi:hypothetical protein